MDCPKCRGSMDTVPSLVSHAHRCAQCGGLWFDMGEHELMKPDADAIDTGDASVGDRNDAQDRIDCPVCSGHPRLVRMVDPLQPHIRFESCKYCYGRFYDAGEFKDFAERDIRDWFKSRNTTARD